MKIHVTDIGDGWLVIKCTCGCNEERKYKVSPAEPPVAGIVVGKVPVDTPLVFDPGLTGLGIDHPVKIKIGNAPLPGIYDPGQTVIQPKINIFDRGPAATKLHDDAPAGGTDFTPIDTEKFKP